MILFSIMETVGNTTINRPKYVIEATWPSTTNGYSTGCLPIQVRIRNVATKTQKDICERGRKEFDSFFEVFSKGRRNNTKMAAINAITPPSLLGIDRSIAYANRKYHSGCMCGGVTKGFAGMKFSGSFSAPGNSIASEKSTLTNTINPTVSFVV